MPRKNKKDIPIEKKLAGGPMDLPFLMLVLLLVGIGLVMVLSASYASAYYASKDAGGQATYYFIRQARFAFFGLIAMYFVTRFDYQRWRPLAPFVLLIATALMGMVFLPGIGSSVGVAKRWVILFGIRFQPSEFAKIGVIIYFAARLSTRDERKGKLFDPREPKKRVMRFFESFGFFNRRTPQGRLVHRLDRVGFLELVPYGLILGMMVLLLALQRHMSATILILLVGAAILFAGGIKKRWFIIAGVLAAAVLGLIIMNTDYMTDRIMSWQNPWAYEDDEGFQVVQSLLAVGSGGLLGLGLGNSRQKFLYLPEEHNDFIFAVVCEELGLVGAGLILILFALLIVRGFWLALHARDRFGTLLVVGIMSLFAIQIFFNVAVVTGLVPPTGISLPFFSYGGTALMIQLAEMGIVLAVSRQIPAPKAE